MNKYLKAFINTSFTLSLFFLGLILAEYLFSFNIILPVILSTIIFISVCITFICSLTFLVLIYHKNFRELYFKNIIDFYDIVSSGFYVNVELNIKADDIKDLLIHGQISFEQLNQLNYKARYALENNNIRSLFINNNLSFEQLNQINYNARNALDTDCIRELFINNQLSLEKLTQLDYNARDALDTDCIRELFINNQLSLEQLTQLEFDARQALAIDNIRYLFGKGLITFDQLFQINRNARRSLEMDSILYLILNNYLNFDQIIYCNFHIRSALENDCIRNLFINNYFTYEQLVEYDRNRIIRRLINDLRDDDIYNRIINNEMTWNDFIRNLFQARLQLQNLNDNSQSTHTASIHESVSDSAIALTNKYGKNINKTNVIKHVKKLKNNIKHFTPNETITPHIYEAAKRGINRLANFDTDFIDPKSQISIKQLIALTHIAAQDNDYRLHTYNHYLEAMILALYEIQRGYNLDAAGIDNMRQDIPICTAGTFNKIIEKMVGILPDCHIHFITFDIINFKANQLVKNLIFQFFDDRASLALDNEADLISLEFLKPKEYINLLKDIESNDYSNRLLHALLKELSNHIEQALRKIFGAHLDRHFNNYFTIEHFILNALSQNEIKTLVTKKVDAISCQHNYKQRIYADFSLFYSSKPTKKSKGLTLNLRKQTFSNVRTSIDYPRQ